MLKFGILDHLVPGEAILAYLILEIAAAGSQSDDGDNPDAM